MIHDLMTYDCSIRNNCFEHVPKVRLNLIFKSYALLRFNVFFRKTELSGTCALMRENYFSVCCGLCVG